MTHPEPRQDVLASICLTHLPTTDADIESLRALSDVLVATYAYFEIVAVSDPSEDAPEDQLLAEIPNLRILHIRPGASEYKRRVIAAAEAIGDVVLLTDLVEIPLAPPVAMINAAETSGRVVAATRPRPHGPAGAIIGILGRSSNLSVSVNHLRTAAYPRTALNRLLDSDDRDLALRFPPARRHDRVLIEVTGRPGGRRPLSYSLGRAGLVQKLLTNSAPAVLTAVSLASVALTLFALALSIYAVLVWTFADTIQPGWFSTTLAMGILAMFMGVAIFGISAGLQKAPELLRPQGRTDVLGEVNRTDLFRSVTQNLNVEIETEARTKTAP